MFRASNASSRRTLTLGLDFDSKFVSAREKLSSIIWIRYLFVKSKLSSVRRFAFSPPQMCAKVPFKSVSRRQTPRPHVKHNGHDELARLSAHSNQMERAEERASGDDVAALCRSAAGPAAFSFGDQLHLPLPRSVAKFQLVAIKWRARAAETRREKTFPPRSHSKLECFCDIFKWSGPEIEH